MRKSLLILSLMAFVSSSAFAELSVKDTTNRDYMTNQGYSKATVDATQKSISRVNGEVSDVKQNAFDRFFLVRFIKSAIDPASDDGTFMNHDIHTHPRFDDL